MKIKIFLLALLIIIFSCKENKKEVHIQEKNVDVFRLEIIKSKKNKKFGYAEKTVFKLLNNNKNIDSLSVIIPYSDCENNETICGINYLNGSFKVSDLNNDSFKEIQYAYHHYIKSEQLPKSLKIILFDTKDNKRYFIDGLGVNKFDELTIDNPIGQIIEISKKTPKIFFKAMKNKWISYSFEHKLPKIKEEKKVQIIVIEESSNNKSNNFEYELLPNIKTVKLIGGDKENIEILLKNNEIYKFENPIFQIDYHEIELIKNKIVRLKNMDNKRSYIETFWFFDDKKKSLILFKSYAESYDFGKITKYKLNNINYDIKTINSDAFFDEIYNSDNEITD